MTSPVRSIPAVFGILLLASVTLAGDVIATMGDHELTTADLQEQVANQKTVHKIMGTSGALPDEEIRTQVILAWADEQLKSQMKARTSVSEAQVQRVFDDWVERGLIPPFTPAMQHFNQLALDTIDLIEAGEEPTAERRKELLEASRAASPWLDIAEEDGEEYWERQFELWAAGQACRPCHAVTAEDYDAMHRDTIILLLSREAMGREAAEFYGLLDSKKLLGEAREIVEANGYEITPEDALEVLLLEREAERWKVLTLQGHLAVHDQAVNSRVYEALRQREEKLTMPLASFAWALQMRLVRLNDRGDIAMISP